MTTVNPRPPRTDKPTNYTHMPRSVELGKFANSEELSLNSSPMWEEYVCNAHGRSCLASLVSDLLHPAAVLLQRYRINGAFVRTMTPEWSKQRIGQALKRGSRPLGQLYLGFLEQEMVDMVERLY